MPDTNPVPVGNAITSARVLIVDDEPANVSLLEGVLKQAGFEDITTTTDPRTVSALRESIGPDIVLLDITMPGMDGFAVMEELAPWTGTSTGSYLPILVLTADLSPGTKEKALAVGAKDFLTKPFDHAEVVLRVKNLLETRFLHLELKRQNAVLEERVQRRTAEIWNAATQLEHKQQELRLSREETVHRLSIAVELRANESPHHIVRMSNYCALLARAAGWDEEQVELIRVASQMHDVGNIGIPDKILLKRRALTPNERAILHTHPQIGYEILTGSSSELLRLAASIAHTHHERMDGKGYPNGLKGEEIPVEGRIAAIADVYDTLTSDRAHRKAFPFIETIKIMTKGRATHFDAELLNLFLDSMDAVLHVQEAHADNEQSPRPTMADAR